MNVTPSARPLKVARVATALLALSAASLTAVTTSGAAGSPSTATASTVAACATATSSHDRVRADQVGQVSDPNDATAAQARQMDSRMHARLAQRRLSLQKTDTTSRRIDVYVHVIEKKNGKGGVSTSRIKKQIDVLNKAYAGTTSPYSVSTGFTFKLKKIDRTKNSGWYAWGNPQTDPSDDTKAKNKLHKGGKDDLNLYLASLSDGLLGYATFPDEAAWRPKQDGVVVLNESLPGGKAQGQGPNGPVHYNYGDTATHEVGHWLGLLHTFEGEGCSTTGDYVDDTPTQDYDASDFSACDESVDTCTLDPGNDPVHNFMNYTDDACMNRFTPGQAARMVEYWDAYRSPVSPA